jgi:hypothetical protein
MWVSEINVGAEADMRKKAKSGPAKSTEISRLAADVEREVQRRLGPKSTFEQRNDMSAQVMQEVLFKRSDGDLRSMATSGDEVVVDDDENDARYRASRTSRRRRGTLGGGARTTSRSRCTGRWAFTMGRRSSRSNCVPESWST